MTISALPPAEVGQRLDLHNATVEESAAAAGRCAMTHLRTGRVCGEPQHHTGGCSFVTPPSAGSGA
jgi:hypothetical protein